MFLPFSGHKICAISPQFYLNLFKRFFLEKNNLEILFKLGNYIRNNLEKLLLKNKSTAYLN